MKEALNIIQYLKETQGTNAKIDLLSKSKENTLLLSILNIVYNPTITTNIASKKLEKYSTNKKSDVETEYLLDFLENKCTGKGDDVVLVNSYINNFELDYEKELLSEVACQSLSIGLDYKNINKALGYDFISILNPMLAYPLETKLDKIKDGTKFSASLKLDGFRCLVILTEGVIVAYSRKGLQLEGYEQFLNEIKESLPFDNYIYDGELLTQEKFKDSKEGYKAISKIARTKGVKNKDLMCFNCFDLIPISEFKLGKGKKIYSERRLDLDRIVDTRYINSVKPMGIFEATDLELSKLLDKVVCSGSEGLMINQLSSYYETKRSTGILKMKKFYTCDLICKGILTGQGSFKNTLGSIHVDYKGFDLYVGSGFSKAQRNYYYNNPEEIVGKIIEVSYFEETSNQNGGLSLRFPVFKTVRDDKNEVSYE